MQRLFIIVISYWCPCYQITPIIYMFINNMAIRDGIPRPAKHAILNIHVTTGLSQFNVII